MKRLSTTSRLRRIRLTVMAVAATSIATLVLLMTQFNFSEQSYPTLAAFQRSSGVNQPTSENVSLVPQVIGHRGSALKHSDGRVIVGNTMKAIRAGIKSGADWIEIDIRPSSDGVLMVFHDDSVKRVTNGEGKVDELTRRELQSLSIAVAPEESIPTLAAVFDEFSRDNVKFVLDIKAANLRDKLLPLIGEHFTRDQIILFGTFDILLEYVGSGYALGYTALWSERSNGYRFPLGQSFLLERCETLACDYLVLPNIFLNQSLVDRASAQDLEVWSYGSDNERDWRHCARQGVTGLIVDHPEIAVQRFDSP